MQAITSPKTDTLSFLDQCTFVCLKYIVRYASLDILHVTASSKENLRELRDVAVQEAAEFGEDSELLPLVYSAYYLANITNRATFDDLRLQECLNTLRSFLEQDVFEECVDVFIRPPVDNIEKVALLSHLIYKMSEVHGKANIGAAVEIGVRYMRKAILEFVNKEGGWKGIATQAHSQAQGDLSSSMVIVDADELKNFGTAVAGSQKFEGASFELASRDSQHLSSPSSPPFSIPSSINTDDDRESLATPPEIIENPLVTDTYLKISQDQFEKAREIRDKMESQISDYAKEPPTGKVSTPTDNKDPLSLYVKNITLEATEPTKAENQKDESVPQESILGGYLPHLSVGFAAVAAIASLLVLKKNT